MISIRRNTFETNSSSTHCIAFNDLVKYDEEYLKQLSGVITPYQDGDNIEYSEVNIYEKPEDKIKWLLTSLKQAHTEPDIDKYTDIILSYLKELCPKLTVDMLPNIEYYYEWEDIEYAWDKYEAECSKLLDRTNFKKFLLEGTIIWGDRDYSEYHWGYYIDDKIEDNYKEIWCKYSG